MSIEEYSYIHVINGIKNSGLTIELFMKKVKEVLSKSDNTDVEMLLIAHLWFNLVSSERNNQNQIKNYLTWFISNKHRLTNLANQQDFNDFFSEYSKSTEIIKHVLRTFNSIKIAENSKSQPMSKKNLTKMFNMYYGAFYRRYELIREKIIAEEEAKIAKNEEEIARLENPPAANNIAPLNNIYTEDDDESLAQAYETDNDNDDSDLNIGELKEKLQQIQSNIDKQNSIVSASTTELETITTDLTKTMQTLEKLQGTNSNMTQIKNAIDELTKQKQQLEQRKSLLANNISEGTAQLGQNETRKQLIVDRIASLEEVKQQKKQTNSQGFAGLFADLFQ